MHKTCKVAVKVKNLEMMAQGVIKSAMADGLITFLWVFCASTLGVLTSIITSTLGMVDGVSRLLITTTLVFIFLFIFGFVGEALGGASFNPSATAALYAVGIGSDTDFLFSAALRFPAQAIGAVGGALAILQCMPTKYKHMLGGPSLKVDIHTGAIAECVLTFTLMFLVLFMVLRGPRSALLRNLLLSISTVSLVVFGSKYTGPSMNPANAFGWAYVRNRHGTFEQFYVYWISPFVGAILAAWSFLVFFPPPGKQIKAKEASSRLTN
ncbi:hypothetical protein Leryth_018150 [Lithospermum erythrorhizon]|uniref:Uncharacterized protein n=1 Tax=Lithospermum erythrorhizon TaxID=34254 RepID=A0AAV3Q9F4_LITER|nr:hypothetical protein Leryth_018150 [Lithospermum erythrorhizon]